MRREGRGRSETGREREKWERKGEGDAKEGSDSFYCPQCNVQYVVTPSKYNFAGELGKG